MTEKKELTITLSLSDRNNIKDIDGLATMKNNTYLRYDAAAVEDTSMIPSDSLTIAIPAFNYIRDMQPPTFDSFVLDLDGSPTLLLTFSETVDADTLDPTGITLQSGPDSSANTIITLEGGEVSASSGKVVTLELTEDDSCEDA